MVKVKNKPLEASWKLAEPAPEALFARFPEYPRPIVQLFHNRGLTTDETIDRFLHPEYSRDLHDPFLLGGISDAVRTIQGSIAGGERIMIHGDYDADGLTSAAVLHDVLKRLGADVGTFVPSRYEEGYGVAAGTLQRFQREGVKLVVTVDCGISDASAIAAARSAGLKVVVTDHHVAPSTIPAAEAVVNPNLPDDPYPNRDLTGVGVAFKLAQALLQRSGLPAATQEQIEKWLLDLVAVGTVADMGRLHGENRALVRFGLLVLPRTRRPGLRKLLKLAGVDTAQPLTSETIGFAIAPRLNAPGRVGHAREALRLLTTDDETEAERLATALERTNQERRQLTLTAVSAAREQLGTVTSDDRIIILDGDWKSGVVGLVAGRLVQEFARPAVVVERGPEFSRGSIRSTPAFHVAEALQAHGELLESYGGHAQAGGFTVATANLETFRDRLTAFARQTISVAALSPEVEIAAELDGADLGWPLLEQLEAFEPFGIGNPQPSFLLRGVMIEDVAVIGRDQSHLRLQIRPRNGASLTAVAFGMVDRRDVLDAGPVDLVGQLTVNEFNGSKSLEWRVADFRPA